MKIKGLKGIEVTKANAVEVVTANRDFFIKMTEKALKDCSKWAKTYEERLDSRSYYLGRDPSVRKWDKSCYRDAKAETRMNSAYLRELNSGIISKKVALSLCNLDNGMIPREFFKGI